MSNQLTTGTLDGTNEAYLVAYDAGYVNTDSTLGRTYNLDLGVTYSALASNATAALTAFEGAGKNLSTDANWNTFRTGGTDSIQYGIFAAGDVDTQTNDGVILSGLTAPQANIDPTVNWGTAIDSINAHAAEINLGLVTGALSSVIKQSPDNYSHGQATHDLAGLPINTVWTGWTANPLANYGTANNVFLGQTHVADYDFNDGFGVQPDVTLLTQSDISLLGAFKLSGNTLLFAPVLVVTITGTATQDQTLTASNDSKDVDGLTYQWLADSTPITDATASTLTLSQAEVGKAITVTASYTDLLGTSESVTSTKTTNVVNVNDLPTGAVTITGTATQDQILTASNILADIDGLGVIAYQWLADGTAIDGAKTSTLTLSQAEVGKAITVTASYTDLLGTSESVTSTKTTNVVNVNDLPTGTVTITGTAAKNHVLIATNTLADFDGLGAIAYQWLADGTAITGEIGSTLTLAQAQVGKTITLTASYIDQQNTPESMSSSATNVVNSNNAPTGTVTISGIATQNQTLTAANSLEDADGLNINTITYQWLANGTAITDATASTLTLTQAQVGKAITVSASYTDLQNTPESVTSAKTTNVVNVNDLPTGAVTITGTAAQDQILTASNTLADADGLDTIAYQWLADGTAITDATTSTLTLSQAQVGKAITVKAGYTDLLGTAESISSTATSAVVNVNDAPTGAVTITGTAAQDQILTASNTLVDVDGLGTIAYQWLADGTAITGAIASTLTLGEAQAGKAITVTASYRDLLGAAENMTSSATTNVVHANHLPTGAVTITGTAAQDQILTASNTLADIDGLGAIAYQWLADSTLITGATSSTLTLSQAQVGKAITVKAGYTDLLGTAESVSSLTTGAVVHVNHAPTTSPVTLAAIAEHSQARIITQAELLSNAEDSDNNSLTATSLSIASDNGTLIDNHNGTWNYTPVLNDATSVNFNYTITDSVSPLPGTVAGIATLDITPVILTSDPVADLFKSFGNHTNTYIKPEAYTQNPTLNLKYQWIDNTPDAVIIGSTSNDFIKLGGTGNKAANGGGGNDVIDGGTGSSFLTGGDGIETFFLDGRAAGLTWSTLTDFKTGQDHATIWGWIKGVSKVDASFADFNTGGAVGYNGLTLHIQNLLPDGSASGATNSALNSLTLTGHTLAEFGASSLVDLNNQIASGTNTHFIVGQTTDNLGVHGYLSIS